VTKLSSADATLKLGDFGLATEVTGFLHDVVGSTLYHAPEMFTNKGSVASHLTCNTVVLAQACNHGSGNHGREGV